MNAQDPITLTTLRNRHGMEADLCAFGATLTALRLPPAQGAALDVVLGFPSAADYDRSFKLPSPPFLGAVVGLHAGRVGHGTYRDGDRMVQLEKNLGGKHHIHGGSKNLSNTTWRQVFSNAHEVEYSTVADQGRAEVTVRYSLDDANTLHVLLSATTRESVLVNLVQHAYFNLDGHQGDVTRQHMQLNAAHVLETDADLIPTGHLLLTAGSAHDFASFKPCPTEIDHSFVLDGTQPAACLRSPTTGWQLAVSTDQPVMHVFIGGVHCAPLKGKEGATYHRTSGICFEAQNFPDSPNHAGFRNGILRPGETYRNRTAFAFAHPRIATN